MSEQSFTTSFVTSRSPEEVVDAVRDVRGWWSRTLVGDSAEPGDVFTYEVVGVHRSTIRVTEVVPGVRVVWRVLDNRFTFTGDQGEWADTEILFEVAAVGGGTELRFTHVGLIPSCECFDACRDGWTYYIGESLRSLIGTGTGSPDEDPRVPAMRAAGSAG
ncbi:SRPBCC domain-containing protein [Nocardia sp. NPDC052254]|uniref:SRPBCC family protein n=1 Tax=Nocardia sp. NPDC052254 TaxID=3155681 RepID=UPI00341333A4